MNASQAKLTYVSRRSHIVLILFFSIFSGLGLQISHAQEIDKDGIFKPAGKGTPYKKGVTVKPPTSFSDLGAAEFKRYKDLLLLRVNATIYNLEDDSLELKDQYRVLWSDQFVSDFISELKDLKKYLETGIYTINKTFKYMPAPDIIEGFKKQKNLSISGTRITKPDSDELQVVQKDLLASYLLQEYNATFRADHVLSNWFMDMNYVRGWREVESWAESVTKIKSTAEALRKDVFSADQKDIDALKKELGKLLLSNSLTVWIQNSDFIKHWLWYTSGQMAINPLLVTSPERKYPEKEKYTFLTADKKVAQADLEKKDLIKYFQQTDRIFNKILLPVSVDDKKLKLHEFDLSNEPVVVSFPDETLDEGEKLKIVMYNVSTSRDLTLTQGTEPLKYPGRIMSELDSIAKIVGVLTTFGANNISTITALTTRLNPGELTGIQYNFKKVDANASFNFAKAKNTFNWDQKYMNFNLERIALDTATKKYPIPVVPIEPEPEPATFALINGQYVPLTTEDLTEDKRRILYTTKAFTEGGKFHQTTKADKELIQNFILADVSFLDYRNNATFQSNVGAMVERFRNFEKLIKSKIANLDGVIADAVKKHKSITPYLRFINRSLPPMRLDSKLNKDPAYVTKINDVTVPEAPKKINIIISEKDTKTNESEDLAKETIKVIQTKRFDVSAGIGYTFTPYDISSQSGTALPTSKTGDAAQFVAGLHIYFWKPLNRLHANPFKHADEKVSLYLGLTLKNALDHYFAGLSYDLTPGLRLIGGVHYYNNPRFEIVNDAVGKKASGLTNAGGFMSLNIQAATLGKLIGLFK